MDEHLVQSALNYHRFPNPGKISITPTKSMVNQRDLALAYSPGVAIPCMSINKDPLEALNLTSRGNLVAVISNGTAVLGLGNIGALASKPVMEGKGCLFKKFAGIDVFDIEIDETDPEKLVEIIASLEPTFGGINLEDIKSPECFYIETKLRERMKIPVFHDDQHGTAIVTAAAVINGLKVVGKRIENVKLVCSGAGAAALACLDLLVNLGLRKENIFVTDSKGVVYQGRTESWTTTRRAMPSRLEARTLADIMPGCRHLPGPVGRRRAEARDGQGHGRQAADPGDGEPGAGDPPRTGEGGQAGLRDRHRAVGLSQPGQQRPVLPLHLPRRAGCRRHDHQRGNEDGGDAGDRRHRGSRTVRCGDLGLWHSGAVRPGIPDPAPVRPAPDHDRRSGGGGSGHEDRRRHPADHRHESLPRPARQLRLPLRHGHAAGLRRRRGDDEAGLLRRGRGRPGAAGGPGGGR